MPSDNDIQGSFLLLRLLLVVLLLLLQRVFALSSKNVQNTPRLIESMTKSSHLGFDDGQCLVSR